MFWKINLQHSNKRTFTTRREVARLSKAGGIKKMNTLPDAVIVLDVGNEKNAVKEATIRIPQVLWIPITHQMVLII